jgi:hypothetical protein
MPANGFSELYLYFWNFKTSPLPLPSEKSFRPILFEELTTGCKLEYLSGIIFKQIL